VGHHANRKRGEGKGIFLVINLVVFSFTDELNRMRTYLSLRRGKMRKLISGTTVLCCLATILAFVASAQPVDEDLLIYLPLDEGEGEIAIDASGKGHDGEIHGAEWTDGKLGKALEFAGNATSYVIVPDEDVMAGVSDTDEFTMQAWFMLLSHADYDGIVSISSAAGAGFCAYRIMVNPGSLPFYDCGQHVDRTVGGFSFELDKWYHYSMTYDGSEATIYVDGEKVGGGTEGIELIETFPLFLAVGESQGVHHTNGVIDEVAVYKRALTQDEVRQTMESGVALSVELGRKMAASWGLIKTKYE
jgi:hypothetical protein